MKHILLAGLASFSLLPALSTREPDELRVVYPAGAEVAFEENEWRTLEGKDASMKINGQDASEEMVQGLKESMVPEREDKVVRYTTWFDEVEDGRPVGARRRFDELGRTEKKGDEESEEEGELDGRTLHLSSDPGGGAVAARLPDDDEGPELDEVYLLNHRLAFELELYLPGKPVEAGDTWDLSEAAVRELLNIDVEEPTYFESEASAENEDLERAMREGVEVTGSVKYERREDVDGVACAVLLVKLSGELFEANVDPAAFGMEEQEGMENSAMLSTTLDGEERLWFALEAGRPVRSQGEWKGEMHIEMNMTNDDVGMEVEMGMVMEVGGGWEQSWSFEDGD